MVQSQGTKDRHRSSRGPRGLANEARQSMRRKARAGAGLSSLLLREFWAPDEDRLYNVVLGAKRGRVEARQAQRFYVDERRAPQNQVAEDLADRGGLEESVSGEPGRIKEARDA